MVAHASLFLQKYTDITIQDEMMLADRQTLDAVVFDIMEFTQMERDAVYEEILGLVNNRVNKARSI